MEKEKTPILRAIEACVPTTQTELARRIGATVQQVNTWVQERRPIPPHKAVEIEIAVNGAVKAEDLNPMVAKIRGTHGGR